MGEHGWQGSLDFRFYDRSDEDNVNLIYVDEESPSSIFLKFEIQNNTGVELKLKPYTKLESNTNPDVKNSDISNTVSAENYHIELRFRPGTLSTASLVQIDLGEYSKEQWMMSRPVFHDNKEFSLYLLKRGNELTLGTTSDTNKTSLTLRGFAANSAGGARGTNVIINYNNFLQKDDTVPISGSKILSLTILSHRGERKAPLSICFATHNTVLNDGESTDSIELQITNIGRDAIALSASSEFAIEIDGEADGSDEPWAVAKKDEAANFNIAIKPRLAKAANGKSWYWKCDTSTIDKNVEEPRFTFREISRQVGYESALKSYLEKQSIELPSKLESEVIRFVVDSPKALVASPETVWKNGAGYSLAFQSDGNLVLYNSSNTALWATNTCTPSLRGTKLKFYPNGNLVLYQKEKAIWSTQKTIENKSANANKPSKVCLELRADGNLVTYALGSPDPLFETGTVDGKVSTLDAVKNWKQSPVDIDDVPPQVQGVADFTEERSFPSNEDLIFTLSNVKSSLASGQGQIRIYYKNLPGYADGFAILNLYKTHLIERGKKIGIGKYPETELDVKGTVSITQDLKAKGNITSTKTITAGSFMGVGAAITGMIVMWYGESDKIPDGWAICNGNNGTPDLTDKFIVGAGSKFQAKTQGGKAEHNHGINVDVQGCELSLDQIPSHSHLLGSVNRDGNPNGWKDGGRNYWRDPHSWEAGGPNHIWTDHAGGGKSHYHGATASSTSVDHIPPYYALFFIMKIK